MPSELFKLATINEKPLKIVVVGFGFAGFSFCKAYHKMTLGRRKANSKVIVINSTDEITFMPLLPDVAAGLIQDNSITVRISALAEKYGFSFVKDLVTGINPKEKSVVVNGTLINYDWVVLSTGSSENFHGITAVQTDGVGLGNLSDAEKIKGFFSGEIKDCDIASHQTPGEDGTYRCAIIGGGISGVEVAANMAMSVNKLCVGKKRNGDTGIALLEASERILPKETTETSNLALGKIKELGVHLELKARVNAINNGHIILADGRELLANFIIWTAGIKPNSNLIGLPDYVKDTSSRRIIVNDQCRVIGIPDAFALGDCAFFRGKDHLALTENASVAVQQGRFLGKYLSSVLSGNIPIKRPSFNYHDYGHVIQVGNNGIYVGPGDSILNGAFARLIAWSIHFFEVFTNYNRKSLIVDFIHRLTSQKHASSTIVDGKGTFGF